MITGTEVPGVVTNMDVLIESSKFGPGFHLGWLVCLTIVEPNTPISQYGYKDPSQQALAIYDIENDRRGLGAVTGRK
jgi:hypothetical protein